MPESQETEKKQKKKEKSPLLLLSGIAIILTIGIFLIWFIFFISPTDDENKTSFNPQPQTFPQILAPTSQNPNLSQPDYFPNSTGKLLSTQAESSGTNGPNPETNIIETTNEPDCEELAAKLNNFFTQVDQKEYLKTFKLKEPSQDYFLRLINKLLENPPVVVREADDLFTILKNMAHLFRVLGGDNIILIKTVMDREAEKVEDITKEFYLYTITAKCDQDIFPLTPSIEKIYKYAGFFINTMGGRSYLFRRDSRSRLLLSYYSILIIDLANKNSMNQYGIEIKQSIAQLINEIESTNQLIYKESYLDKLYELSEKYPLQAVNQGG